MSRCFCAPPICETPTSRMSAAFRILIIFCLFSKKRQGFSHAISKMLPNEFFVKQAVSVSF